MLEIILWFCSALQFAGGNLFGGSAGGAEKMRCAALVARLTWILLDTEVNPVAPISLEQARQPLQLQLSLVPQVMKHIKLPGSASTAFGAGAMPCCSHFVPAPATPGHPWEEAQVQPSVPQAEAELQEQFCSTT